MKSKYLVLLIAVLFVSILYAIEPVYLYDRNGTHVNPGQLHTGKNTWVVIDATTSADNEVTNLAADERTYATVVAAIAAASSTSDGNGEISIYGESNNVELECRQIPLYRENQ